MIDLHCHSSASDGVLSPSFLPLHAINSNISALALTDHDTTDGLDEFMDAAKKLNFNAIPGLELSCRISSGDKCHIVGLFIDWKNTQLQHILRQIIIWRQERNLAILEKLCDIGMPVTLEEALSCGEKGCVLGRPHIASAMVKKGYCSNSQAAFKKYIGRGRDAYVYRQTPTIEEGLAALHAAGAVTIWAHPMTSDNMTGPKLRRITGELIEAGLDGIEAYYPDHTPTQTQNVLKIANETGLLVSGGSDFHGGDRHRDIKIGIGKGGSFQVPDELLPPIRNKAMEIAQSH